MSERLAHEGDARDNDGEDEKKNQAESCASAVSAANGVIVLAVRRSVWTG